MSFIVTQINRDIELRLHKHLQESFERSVGSYKSGTWVLEPSRTLVRYVAQVDVSAAKIYEGSLKACRSTFNAKTAFVSLLADSRDGTQPNPNGSSRNILQLKQIPSRN